VVACTPTVSLLNLGTLTELLTFLLDSEFCPSENIRLNILEYPLYYNIKAAPPPVKAGIKELLKKFSAGLAKHPAVIAQMWSDTIKGRLLIGWALALSASVAGILWSFYSDYPTGPAVVMMLAAFLIVSGGLYSVVNSEARQRLGAEKPENPNGEILAELVRRGVQIELCEDTMRQKGVAATELMPGVKLVVGAYPRLIDLQLQGFAYIKFE